LDKFMRDPSVSKTGGEHLVNALVAQGVTHVFCVPGESYLAVLDALYAVPDKITVITCRHEAAAANMADAYGKLTGRAGVCMVTRGPGACHAAIGVHTAFQDSTPMVLFIGQVARSDRHREAFQEVDYAQMFAPLAKQAEEIQDAARVPEYVARAFAAAQNGRPGPVVVALPEDMLVENAAALSSRAVAPPQPAVSAADHDALAHLLGEAERPFLILGGSGWSDQGLADIRTFVEAWDLPVGTSFRAKDLFDNTHPNYAGDVGIGINPKLKSRIQSSDLVIVVGARLGEMTTSGYRLFGSPTPAQILVHVHRSAEELGRVFTPTLAIQAAQAECAKILAALPVLRQWSTQAQAAHLEYQDWIQPVAVTGDVNLSEIWTYLSTTLPADTIIASGAGNFSIWTLRYYQHQRPHTLVAPTNGAMGYGLPAGIAAKLLHADRTVIVVHGDGCFLMTGNELATAVKYQLKLIILVCDNGSYGTIRMHQERDYPGRTIATELQNPDFAAYARSFGAFGFTVEQTDHFAYVFQSAQECTGPALIHIKTSPRDIAPGRTI
jgi:acetolactate synthase I/II/III large subunit